MTKLKTFFRTFVKSFQPNYYKDILKAKFSFSLKYLTFLLFVISLGYTLFIAAGLLVVKKEIPGFVEKTKKVVTTAYPQELVVSVKNHKLVTNVKEPYVVADFIVINTKANVEDVKNYKSQVLVTDSFVVYSDKEGQIKAYSLEEVLKDLDGVVLNKDIYQKLTSEVLPYIDQLPTYFNIGLMILILLGPIVGTILSLGWYLFYLLIFSVVLLIAAKLLKKDLSYSQVYKLGMHAVTLPILITLLVHFPLLFSLILLVFMIIVFTKLDK
ncbi:MAG TPA: DUF1189 family protein [Alphaproteobacteria bacterium]|jgi:hypothetical protein|nr:DUF1189 family protein [Alphaproteobacteria bacterium]